MQRKTHRPVQFEVTDVTRQAVLAWIDHAKLASNAFLFPSRVCGLATFVNATVRAHRQTMRGLDRS